LTAQTPRKDVSFDGGLTQTLRDVNFDRGFIRAPEEDDEVEDWKAKNKKQGWIDNDEEGEANEGGRSEGT
jgi:hypothetical protein